MEDFTQIAHKLFEQSVTAGVLFLVLVGFSRWCRKQIQDQRADFAASLEQQHKDNIRCFELQASMQTALQNNTSALHEIKGRIHG